MNDPISNEAVIFVRFEITGIHCWPDAQGTRKYLASPHRHQFHFKVETRVKHNDREIEFHDLINAAKWYVVTAVGGMSSQHDCVEFDNASCEMIAEQLGCHLCLKYARPFTITVSEDGECGATVSSFPPYDSKEHSR